MAENFRGLFPKSEFAKNVLTLFTGTSIAQIVPLVVSPILSRLYTPEDFGGFALFLSIVTIGGVLATGMYESAIILPASDRDAVNLIGVCALVTILVSAVSVLGVALFTDSISGFIGTNIPKILFYLMPVLILITGFTQALNFWAIRQKKYQRIAINKVSHNLVVASFNVGFGALGLGLYGLVFSQFIGQIAANVQLFVKTILIDRLKLQMFSKETMLLNAKVYSDFPRISLPHTLLDTIQASLLFFIIQSIWGATELGFYAFMMRILKSPLTIVGTSVSQVFFQRSSQAFNSNENLSNLLIKTLKTLFYIGLPIFVAMFILSPIVFGFVFGEEWREAGRYARVLSPWLFVNFLYSPVSQLPLTLGKQKTNFLIGTLYNILIIAVVAGSGYLGFDIMVAFQILSVALTIYLILVLVWLLEITKQPYYQNIDKN